MRRVVAILRCKLLEQWEQLERRRLLFISLLGCTRDESCSQRRARPAGDATRKRRAEALAQRAEAVNGGRGLSLELCSATSLPVVLCSHATAHTTPASHCSLADPALASTYRRTDLEKRLQGDRSIPDEMKARQLAQLGRTESSFLRLRRTRLGLDDFRTVKVIGKGAFGEVCYRRFLR